MHVCVSKGFSSVVGSVYKSIILDNKTTEIGIVIAKTVRRYLSKNYASFKYISVIIKTISVYYLLERYA